MPNRRDGKIPRIALLVDADGAVRQTATSILKGAGVDVTSAADGEEALTLFARQWFPVLVTSRETPMLDGLEIVRRVRAFAVAPVYVIMLTTSNDSLEYETGYCAGVDHFLIRSNYEGELATRVATGLLAIDRRQRTGAGRSGELVMVDLASGAHTARHLVGRLHAEIAHASRTGAGLTVLSVCIETPRFEGAVVPANFEAASQALLGAIQDAVRPKRDWITRLPTAPNLYRLAIVMPEAGTRASAVEQSIRNTLVDAGDASGAIQLTIGAAALSDLAQRPTALQLLGESERRRRGLAAQAPSEIRNVQGEAGVQKPE